MKTLHCQNNTVPVALGAEGGAVTLTSGTVLLAGPTPAGAVLAPAVAEA